MSLFFALKDGNLVTDSDIVKSYYLLTGEKIVSYLMDEKEYDDKLLKIIKKFPHVSHQVKSPSVKVLLANGDKVMAIKVMYERDKKTKGYASLVKAKEKVEKIERKMKEEENKREEKVNSD